MQFMFRLDAVHVWAKWYWGSAVLGISGGLLCRASRRNYRASSSAKKPRFRCAENERNERDHRQSRIQDVTAQAAIMARSSSNWAGRRSTRPFWTAPIPSWWLWRWTRTGFTGAITTP